MIDYDVYKVGNERKMLKRTQVSVGLPHSIDIAIDCYKLLCWIRKKSCTYWMQAEDTQTIMWNSNSNMGFSSMAIQEI